MKKNILYLLLPLLMACSCAKDQFSSLAVTVMTDIEGTAPEVKGVIENENFVNTNTFGIFVYHAEAQGRNLQNFQIYGSKYSNIMAKKENSIWKYTLNGLSSSSASENFFLIEPSSGESGALAICAYAPFVDGATSITDIPFTIGGQHSKITDLMWALQNQNSPNLNIKPAGKTETVYLTFRHALSMIRIKLKCKHDSTDDYLKTTMQVSSIKIRKTDDGQTPLYSSGNFNAVTGEFLPESMVNASEVVFDFVKEDNKNKSFSSDSYLDIPILIVPTGYTDGDYEIVFEFNGQTLPTIYRIKQADVMTSDDFCGFKPGKVYTFEFIFNNYAQISGITINTDEEWGTPIVTDMEF